MTKNCRIGTEPYNHQMVFRIRHEKNEKKPLKPILHRLCGVEFITSTEYNYVLCTKTVQQKNIKGDLLWKQIS